MSRRSRRRQATGEHRWIGKAAIALLALAIVALAAGYATLRSYLHSDSFRKFLSAEASEMAGVDGAFAPFHWDGLAVDTATFHATGPALITALRADGLHTEIGLGGVRRGVWEVRGTSLRRLHLALDARPRPEILTPPSPDRPSVRKPARPAWFPSQAELQGIDIREISAEALLPQGRATATGIALTAEQAGARDAYRARIEGGEISLPLHFLPQLRIDRAQLRYQHRQLFLTQATLGAWASARLEASGEYDLATHQYSAQGDATGIQCQDLLSPDWSKRLTGLASSDFTLHNRPGHPLVTGTLTLRDSTLTALPLLDVLAAYADTRRFRVLPLSEARTTWRWENGTLTLTDLTLASDGLVRLQGSLEIRGRALAGLFRLGLAPGTLAHIPGAETDVFTPGERGLLWTTLRISGTLDDPKEDLTDRIIAAAGLRMFEQIPETGQQALKFTRSLLADPSTSRAVGKGLEKGVHILDQGQQSIRQVRGLLDGILGGGSDSGAGEPPAPIIPPVPEIPALPPAEPP